MLQMLVNLIPEGEESDLLVINLTLTNTLQFAKHFMYNTKHSIKNHDVGRPVSSVGWNKVAGPL